VTFASIVVMPILARAKRRAAAALGSGALRADARQADFCAYLSAIVIAGLLLNRLFGWWWADPVAGLTMTPIISREGFRRCEPSGAAIEVTAIRRVQRRTPLNSPRRKSLIAALPPISSHRVSSD